MLHKQVNILNHLSEDHTRIKNDFSTAGIFNFIPVANPLPLRYHTSPDHNPTMERTKTPPNGRWASDVERQFLISKIDEGRDAKKTKSHNEFIAAVADEFTMKFPEGRKRALKLRGYRQQDIVTHLSDGDSPAREERLPLDLIFRKVSGLPGKI